MKFVDKWPDSMVYEATKPDDREEIKCTLCGKPEYKDCAKTYNGEYYCSDECKEKVILDDAGDDDFKAFVLSDVKAFMNYLKSNDYKPITENFERIISAKDMWNEIFEEYASDCRYEFSEWYEWMVEEKRRSA